MTDAERRVALDAIAAEVAVCTRCRLHQGRTKSVPGEGTAATEVMFVGEGPGQNEDRQGQPFVGQAGSLLDELLTSIGWSRGEVFVTNVVKCRPPGNRDPEPDEIAACAPFLVRQLAALDPALVVSLGRFSMGRFRPGAKISQAHGTFVPAVDGSGAGDALTFSMYHPAAALHQGSLKETLFADMQGVPAALTESRSRRAARPKTEPDAGIAPAVESETKAPEAPPARARETEPSAPERVILAPAAAEPVRADSAADSPTREPDPASQLPLF